MSNINFDNPFLLLIGIPLLLIVIIPFIISVKRDNINKHNVTSFIFHIIICLLITLVFAKTTYEMVMTETNIYVLADVSYSSNNNLDLIDDHIETIKDDMPKNSKLGVICFGKDYEITTELGDSFKTVKDNNVDNSETNIVSALEYASSLFEEDVIKRIVIITDGKETNESNTVSLIEGMIADNIYVDAIYLDNNINENINEVQINSIEFTNDVFLNSKEALKVLVQSNNKEKSSGYLKLYKNNELVSTKAESFTKGFNVVNFDLNTAESGNYNYRVELLVSNDTSGLNNVMQFKQNVTSQPKMLFVSAKKADKAYAEALYGNTYDLDTIIVDANNKNVPFTIEQLCDYDTFVLSNLNVAEDIENPTLFLSSIDTLVSKFGKSLITLGNTYIQSNEEIKNDNLTQLSNMLPVNYGNNETETKVVAIVLDISRSMENLERYIMAKEAAIQLLDYLEEDDLVTVIGFAGEIQVVQPITTVSNKESIIERINSIEMQNGTYLYHGMQQAKKMLTPYANYYREMFILSDGLPYSTETYNERKMAEEIAAQNITISTLNTGCDDYKAVNLMTDIAEIGGGNYYFAKDLDDVKDVIINDIADDITDTVIEKGNFNVDIKISKDDVLNGIVSLPVLNGYYFSTPKSSANVVLSSHYVNKDNKEFDVPIYAYWNYGEGNVASFSSDISSEWTANWLAGTTGEALLINSGKTNIPNERIDSPFILNTKQNGTSLDVIVTAPSLNVGSKLILNVEYPEGNSEDIELIFDSKNYVATIDCSSVGNYEFNLSYTLGNKEYTDSYTYTLSYLSEYNSFEDYQVSDLYFMINNNGEVSENGKLKLENNNSYVETYIYDFTNVFMIICVVLFVLDIIVRKLKWNDIKTLFRFKKR